MNTNTNEVREASTLALLEAGCATLAPTDATPLLSLTAEAFVPALVSPGFGGIF